MPVLDGDTPATLHERIKEVERRLYPATLAEFVSSIERGRAGARRAGARRTGDRRSESQRGEKAS